MDAARRYFDEFDQGGAAAIEATVAARRVEDLHLDFKLLERGGAPLTRDDRKSLAEALSGFANADGGVIVWGVSATRDPEDGVDAARELRPIQGLVRLRSDLESLTAQLSAPVPAGVLHRTFSLPSDADAGFALSYVPRGEGEPVMAMGPKQRSYFIRAGGSFLPMEHFQVADRFHRRPQPRIEFVATPAPAGWGSTSGGGRTAHIMITLGISNRGRGIATHPMLDVEPQQVLSDKFRWAEVPPNLGERLLPSHRSRFSRRTFSASGFEAIHPETTLDVCALRISLHEAVSVVEDLCIKYGAYCDGSSDVGVRVVPGTVLTAIRDETLPM